MDLAPSTSLIFVQGKGGVGKSTVASALAQNLSREFRTLLVTIEDPLRTPGQIFKLGPNLFLLNNEATKAFEEYAGLKIGVPALVRIFLQNKLMQYLARAAPGVRELVLMGKIWHERKNFDRIVIDMPATGHGITMFQAIFNWGKLFQGSVLSKDANAMNATFADPAETSHLVVSLPEEMPLVESLELRDHLIRLFPKSDVRFVVNRLFPSSRATAAAETDDRPFSRTVAEHAARKARLEAENLELWQGIDYARLPYFPPPLDGGFDRVRDEIATYLETAP